MKRLIALIFVCILLATPLTAFADAASEDYTGIQKAEDGSFYYYSNGKIDRDYTGFVKNSSHTYYVKSGTVRKDITGFVLVKGFRYYVAKGRLQDHITGFVKHTGNQYYVVKGVLQSKYTGLAKGKTDYWYVNNGRLDSSFTGFVQGRNNTYYVKRGKVRKDITGLVKVDGQSYYVKKGQLKSKYTGLVEKNNKFYYVKKGKLDRSFTGFAKGKNNSWYVEKGLVNKKYTGLAKSVSNYYYAKDGKLMEDYTGPAYKRDSSQWCHVKNGKMARDYTGNFWNSSWNYSVWRGMIHDSAVRYNGRSFYVNGDSRESSLGSFRSSKVGSANPSVIEISIDDQYLWYYVNGQCLLSSPVVTGKPNQGKLSTPKGMRYVYHKTTNTRLKGDDYDVKVKYWIGIDRSGYYGIHDASWRNSFGGSIYTYDPSHGCVNMPESKAAKLYSLVRSGYTDVYIY